MEIANATHVRVCSYDLFSSEILLLNIDISV